jgi:hypothetical protein
MKNILLPDDQLERVNSVLERVGLEVKAQTDPVLLDEAIRFVKNAMEKLDQGAGYWANYRRKKVSSPGSDQLRDWNKEGELLSLLKELKIRV